MPVVVFVVANQKYRSGRDVLAGIDEASRLDRWRVVLVDGTEPPKDLRPDGVIGFFDDERAASLQARGTPAVQLGIAVTIDEAAVGECVARHFIGRGLVHGATVSFSDIGPFGPPRTAGFRAAMPNACPDLDLPLLELGSQFELLVPWLQGLPKPIGIFAINDYVGQIVLAGCVEAGLAVPEQVSVVGVDNDLSMCLSGICPLSSVYMPHRAQGIAGAHRLHRMLTGHEPGAPEVVRPGAVCARVSSDIHHCADEAVSKALSWIRRNYVKPYTIDAVAAAAALNRRTLERRFRALLGRSIHDELRRVRVARAQELLAQDVWLPVAAVAVAVGLSSSAFVSAFAAETGSSPGEWRSRTL